MLQPYANMAVLFRILIATAALSFAGAEVCQDTNADQCASWRDFGFCTLPEYKDYLKTICKKTCGHCAAPPPSPGSCGRPDAALSRVIGGMDARKGAWPWQILMTYFNDPICGGSIIAPNWIVTAAHCVSGRENFAKYFTVRVGEHDFTTTADGVHTVMKVEKIITHPQYNKAVSGWDNDIALMKLSSPIIFGQYVKPVCLPNQNEDVPVGTQCYITGWGRITSSGGAHHTLQQARLAVVSNTQCKNLNTRILGAVITERMVCAGDGGLTTKGGCQGDSGGPFVCQTGSNGEWILHGSVSFGPKNCDSSYGYSVFARMSKFRSWIDQEMSKN